LRFQNRGNFLSFTIPGFAFLAKPWLNKNRDELETVLEGGLQQNNLDLIRLKRALSTEEVLALEDHCNTSIWGKASVVERFGVRLKHFRMGGLNLNNPLFFEDLIKRVRCALRVHEIEFTFHHSSSYKKLFQESRARTLAPELFMKPLDVHAVDFPVLNFSAGLWADF
jgi:hypothetical protein